ncbi:MAG: hypothetical protein KA756_03630 [Steroidobacteraceae bacterium]|nr:hypothetical protein [Steroidobacteraceae bacterium]
MKPIRPFVLLSSLALAAVVAGCASLAVDRMLPPVKAAPTPRFDAALRALPVTGARQEMFGGPALVSNEMYCDALVQALKQSNLFRHVSTEGQGDYELHTELFAQGQGDVALTYRSAMVVQYRIVDTRTRAEVWKKGFNSREQVSVSQAFSGAKRTVTAQEGSVRDNLAQLIAALSTAEFKQVGR